jgi:hypothetical protein
VLPLNVVVLVPGMMIVSDFVASAALIMTKCVAPAAFVVSAAFNRA